jgi:hypothetical protein
MRSSGAPDFIHWRQLLAMLQLAPARIGRPSSICGAYLRLPIRLLTPVCSFLRWPISSTRLSTQIMRKLRVA